MPQRSIEQAKLTTDPTPRYTVTYLLVLRQQTTFQDLLEDTGLSDKILLRELSWLRKNFGLQGNRKKGYSLSPDANQRVAMSKAINTFS